MFCVIKALVHLWHAVPNTSNFPVSRTTGSSRCSSRRNSYSCCCLQQICIYYDPVITHVLRLVHSGSSHDKRVVIYVDCHVWLCVYVVLRYLPCLLLRLHGCCCSPLLLLPHGGCWCRLLLKGERSSSATDEWSRVVCISTASTVVKRRHRAHECAWFGSCLNRKRDGCCL